MQGTPNHRQLYRVAIDRTGQVRRGVDTFACNVIDMTEQGFRLRIDETFPVGEHLHLEFALADGDVLECAIQVTHSEPPHIGAAIIDITPDHQQRLSTFIEQLNALNMTGF
jgi:PilZ domain